MTDDELTVLVESLREYRLRAPLSRRDLIDGLVVKFMVLLAKTDEGGD